MAKKTFAPVVVTPARSAKTVVVRSRLPYALILQIGRRSNTINGLNSTTIVGATFASTEIDAEFWREWTDRNAKSKLLQSGAIFAADDKSARDIAQDAPRTGLDAADPAEDGLVAATGD